MILYKYRTDSSRTEDIIRNKQVWFAKPHTLNDPLECSIQEIAENNINNCCLQEKREQLEGLVFTYIITPKDTTIWGLPKSKIEELLHRIGKAQDFDEKYRIYSNFIYSRTGNYPSDPKTKYTSLNEYLKNVGIFSLSKTCEEELMWGHYADGGKGIAIGFDVKEKRSITIDSICLEVKYSNEPIVLSERLKTVLAMSIDQNGNSLFSQHPAFDDPFLHAVMSTKNTKWSYEKEWRCVERTSGLKDVLSPIKEIVFGLKCPPEIRDKYISLANTHCKSEVYFFEIVLDGRTITKQRIK